MGLRRLSCTAWSALDVIFSVAQLKDPLNPQPISITLIDQLNGIIRTIYSR